MNLQKSKVYVLADGQNRITRCEGGYTMANIKDISQWTLIDEGTGDRYNLCQSHYFEGGLLTMDGIPRYKLEDGKPLLRAEAELEADRAARPKPMPTSEDILLDMAADHEERLCMLELYA